MTSFSYQPINQPTSLPEGNPARVDVVKELAPQCSDLALGKSSILSHLSEFEKMLVGSL